MSSDHHLDKFPPLLLLVVGAVAISFSPVFVKLIGPDRLGPTAIGFWRTFLGGISLFAVVLLRGSPLLMSPRLMGFAALIGLIFFGDLYVWHRSIIFCGAGMSTILGNTQVFATAVISFFVFKERLTTRYFISAVSAMLGVVLLVGVLSDEVELDEQYVRGILYGLATGIFYANYIVTLKWTGFKKPIPDVILFMAWLSMSSAFCLGLAALFETDALLPPDLESWIWLVCLGVIVQAFSWWLITASLHKTAASRAGLILLLQPTLAMVWGVIMFAEQFTPWQLVGAIITLAAIYFGGLRSAIKAKQKRATS